MNLFWLGCWICWHCCIAPLSKKDRVVYAGNAYLDLRDRLMDDNILSGITRITMRKHDGSLVRGRQVLHRPTPLKRSKKRYVPVRRIGKKVDPRQHSLKHCFKLCAWTYCDTTAPVTGATCTAVVFQNYEPGVHVVHRSARRRTRALIQHCLLRYILIHIVNIEYVISYRFVKVRTLASVALPLMVELRGLPNEHEQPAFKKIARTMRSQPTLWFVKC